MESQQTAQTPKQKSADPGVFDPDEPLKFPDLTRLTYDQLRCVYLEQMLSKYDNDAYTAAHHMGVTPPTVYSWRVKFREMRPFCKKILQSQQSQ
ncbi:helix-turn-helix domain-containing protein [Rubinisphaera brasiliensis]|uniref:Uncharacterized protein n=1 Tax=Rubinisphaera brasiliensis (strain ATCC 49424 / DSM 5305 / JCM 21570 / IAM 15109 / NBRC 103401 / IFAM 1448) TaxID=756272 RepID=F0SNK0_RUBBR|nr:helix-turn-helix domain-containing protein [Rubinisphaera brasiliensis]ADY57834.1 hypothetical protein Plabr_0204 [Rubinisphaera brasiliensis DSM 5305]